jgi:hypothetical protein
MIVIGSGLILSGALIGSEANANNPIIGYENLVTASNVSATTEDADHPATALANPATYTYWRGAQGSPGGDDYLTVAVDDDDEIDYVGIARHNFGTGLIPVSVEVQHAAAGAWTEVVADTLLPDDSPVIFRFTPQAVHAVRVRLQPSLATIPVDPEAGVLYVGKLLILQRRIYVGHTPITLGRQTTIITGRSESGNFLGRIQTGEQRSTSVDLQNLTPAWYRAFFDPFVLAAQLAPFFFGWRPLDYPNESGFAWLTEEPQPSNSRPNGMMSVSLKMNGVA